MAGTGNGEVTTALFLPAPADVPTGVEAIHAKIRAGGHASPYRLRKQLPEPVFGHVLRPAGPGTPWPARNGEITTALFLPAPDVPTGVEAIHAKIRAGGHASPFRTASSKSRKTHPPIFKKERRE